jgi:hypothetical protein
MMQSETSTWLQEKASRTEAFLLAIILRILRLDGLRTRTSPLECRKAPEEASFLYKNNSSAFK